MANYILIQKSHFASLLVHIVVFSYKASRNKEAKSEVKIEGSYSRTFADFRATNSTAEWESINID